MHISNGFDWLWPRKFLAITEQSIPGDMFEACLLAFKINTCQLFIISLLVIHWILMFDWVSGLLVFGLGAGESEFHSQRYFPLRSWRDWILVLLSLRTWAVWRKSRNLGIAFCILWPATWVVAFTVNGIFLQTLRCTFWLFSLYTFIAYMC